MGEARPRSDPALEGTAELDAVLSPEGLPSFSSLRLIIFIDGAAEGIVEAEVDIASELRGVGLTISVTTLG